MELEPEKVVRGRGHRKSPALRLYDKLQEYVKRLKCYAKHIETCGEKRNSYSKTDKDASFSTTTNTIDNQANALHRERNAAALWIIW